MSSSLETRIYLAAFAAIGVVALGLNCYLDGRAKELPSRVRAISEAVTEQQHKTAQQAREASYWHGKYIALTKETDAVTVMSADLKFEGRGR